MPVGPPAVQGSASTGDRAGAATSAEGDVMDVTAAEEPQDGDAMGVTQVAPRYRGSRVIPFNEEAMYRREKHLKCVQICTYANSMFDKIAELTLPENK